MIADPAFFSLWLVDVLQSKIPGDSANLRQDRNHDQRAHDQSGQGDIKRGRIQIRFRTNGGGIDQRQKGTEQEIRTGHRQTGQDRAENIVQRVPDVSEQDTEQKNSEKINRVQRVNREKQCDDHVAFSVPMLAGQDTGQKPAKEKLLQDRLLSGSDKKEEKGGFG